MSRHGRHPAADGPAPDDLCVWCPTATPHDETPCDESPTGHHATPRDYQDDAINRAYAQWKDER